MGAGGGVLFRGCFSIREGAAEILTGGELLFGSFWEEEKESRGFFFGFFGEEGFWRGRKEKKPFLG